MQRLAEFWRRLMFLARRREFERDLEEEMRYHLERKAEKNREAGIVPEEAACTARRQFGNATQIKERSRDAWGWGPLEQVAQDLRHSVRTLRNNPGFTAVAVITLALGIGANTAVFSVVNAVLFRPLPMREPGRLTLIWEHWDKLGWKHANISQGNLADIRTQSRTFESMAAMRGGGAVLTIGDEPVPISGKNVSGGFFDVLGAKPALGRDFLPEERREEGRNVAIIGYGLWQRLGADPHIPGLRLRIYGEQYTVVGVMPRGFAFPDESEIWMPSPMDEGPGRERGNHDLRVVGRLRPGFDLQQAQSEMDTIAARLRQAYPEHNETIGLGLTVAGLQDEVLGGRRRALLVLVGVVACVLLIACANVANLMMARGSGRRREIALRLALGASRWRVVRYLLTESVLLAFVGGSVGLAGAWWAVHAFVAFDPIKLPRIQEVAVDGGVLLFTVLVAVGTGVLFGLAPALRISRPDLNEALKDGAATQAPRRSRARAVLAAVQVALAIVLLVGAGLFLHSFVRRVSVPLGFRPEGLVGVELPWSVAKRLDSLQERLRALPGVIAVGAGTAFPNTPANSSGTFGIEGRALQPEPQAGKFIITPEYFSAAGMTLRTGRLLTGADTGWSPKVAVINEVLARRYFPGQDPIGHRIDSGYTIVGIVGNVKGFGVDGDPAPAIYFSYRQSGWGNPVYVLVRTAVPPGSIVGMLRKEIRAWRPGILITKLAPVEDLLSESVAVPRFYMLLVVAFGALAAVVAVVGVYGVISYAAAQRTHEIGVRMALGAARRDVLRMVIGQGLGLILAGVGLGLAGAWASTRVLESLLFQVKAGDALTFTAAALLLTAAGVAACYIPARRATKIDPMRALRYE